MPGSNVPASVVRSSIAVRSGAVVYVDVMMRLWTIKIMLQVVGARAWAYCLVCVQMKPLAISQLSWFWPLVVNSQITDLSLNCTWELIQSEKKSRVAISIWSRV